MRPMLIVFAGPNGSGKSTFTKTVKERCPGFPNLYINADDIALQLGITAYNAAIEAENRRREAIKARRSFAMETVMSTPRKIDLMIEAKNMGYMVHLEYVVIQEPRVNVRRVQTRAAKGGHDVPPDKIISRYGRSIALLPKAFEISDTARIWNNSFKEPLFLAEKTMDGEVRIYPQDPPSKWDEENIRDLLGIRDGDMSGTMAPGV